MADDVSFKAGEAIFWEGYPSDNAYVIVSGEVEIFQVRDNGENQLAILGPGQMFGEIGVMDDVPRTASARALKDTVLRIVAI
ncbi:MAG: cyclic nucleotide-binding domain-containing protein [Alphaproteobacteria bacterium]|nr:cyclic nucleotide-binding domain-containing protein [Alphaproteobacteria bacterium]